MKRLQVLFSLILLIYSFPSYAEEDLPCQIQVALDLCYAGGKNEGFIAAKAAIEKYKDNEAMTMILKESMLFNEVEDRYMKEVDENATEVIRKSSDPLFIGCAWFRKSKYALFIRNYDEALAFASIALKTFEKVSYEAREESVSWRELYECLCHITKRKTYEALGDKEKATLENKIVNSSRLLNDPKKTCGNG